MTAAMEPSRIALRAAEAAAERKAAAERDVARIVASRSDLFATSDRDGSVAVVRGDLPETCGDAALAVVVDPSPRVFDARPAGAPPIAVIGRWSAHPVLSEIATLAALETVQAIDITGSVSDGGRLAAAELDALVVVAELLGPVADYVRTGGRDGLSTLGRVRATELQYLVVTIAIVVRASSDGTLDLTVASNDRVLRASVPPVGVTGPALVTIDEDDGCWSPPARYGLAERTAWEHIARHTAGERLPRSLSPEPRESLGRFF